MYYKKIHVKVGLERWKTSNFYVGKTEEVKAIFTEVQFILKLRKKLDKLLCSVSCLV